MNLLKPYCNWPIPSPACVVGRTSVISVPQLVETELEDGLPSPDPAVQQVRLKNLEILDNLQVLLGHLLDSKQRLKRPY